MRVSKDWTEADLQQLKDMAAQNNSASVIAKAMGRTRNAIVGKCHRSGITLSSTPGVKGSGRNPKNDGDSEPRREAQQRAIKASMQEAVVLSRIHTRREQARTAPVKEQPKQEPQTSKRAPQWTEGELDKLRELIEGGKTYPEISADIGRSDYAVRDKVKKLGLRVTTAGTHAKRSAPMPTPSFGGDTSRRIAAQVEALGGKTECRYPVGNLEHEDFHFCRAKVTDEGSPYCPEHSALCFAKPAPRQRQKERVRVGTLNAQGYF